jgi:D-alanyl-D-alanine carboxypeptidase
MVASARKNGRTMIAVVFGATTSGGRNEHAAELLNDGFSTIAPSMRPKLEAFQSAPATLGPANMREFVCGKGKSGNEEEEEAGSKGLVTKPVLGPRFVLMDPVPVFTGRADADPNAPKPKATAASSVPTPKLRPARVPSVDGLEQGDSR